MNRSFYESPGVVRRGRASFACFTALMTGVILLPCFAGTEGAKAQAAIESPASVEYQVKAGYLVTFAKFVDWPTNALSKNDRLRIGIVDNGKSYSIIAAALSGKSVGPHEIETVLVKSFQDLKSFNMVFVTRSQSKRVLDVIRSVGTAPVLTFGETDGFAVEGGCINFTMSGKKIRFEVNTGAVESAGLKISSRLACMAAIVQTKQEDAR